MSSVPNTRPVVAERLFADLLEPILTGAYEPGERLPGQRELAVEFGVTMTALREALKRLEQMRLIEVRHGNRMVVRDWRAGAGLDVLAHLLYRSGGFDRAVLGDILEARSYMLREAAGLAALRAGPAGVARIKRLARSLAVCTDVEAPALDYAFFTEIVDAAGNLVFALILNAIRDSYLKHPELIPVTRARTGLAPLYAELAAAIEQRDVEGARAHAWALAERQRNDVLR